jgi:dTDP-4-dehydro-6-deoxy-alpha-D-glucopyranose 2,3-dehydratase
MDDFKVSGLDGLEASQTLEWLFEYRRSIGCTIERIRFDESNQWALDEARSTLRHASGRFYTIQGYRGVSNFRPDFWQPLINQPETGTQGFVVRQGATGWELLVQARTEPGNVGLVQIGPTIQATYSNYTAAHKGRRQPFLEHFHHPERFGSRVLVDTVQPELGSRFLKKWNRNIVIHAPTLANYSHPMFRWVSLPTLARLMRLDHIVNNDARLVVGLLALECGADLFAGTTNPLSEAVCRSFRATSGVSFRSSAEVADWLTGVRYRESLHAEDLSLSNLPGWEIADDEIRHERGLHFSVIQLRVHAPDREVTDWDQPLIAASHTGKIVLLVKEVDGVLNLLLRAEAQLGNAHGAELQPTFCDDNDDAPETPKAIRDLLNEKRVRKQFTFEGSDEGGRFFQCISRFDIRWLDSSVNPELPNEYAWLTLGQIRELLAGTDFISDESRSILSLFLTAACCDLYAIRPQAAAA